jgi:hypothetical protein
VTGCWIQGLVCVCLLFGWAAAARTQPPAAAAPVDPQTVSAWKNYGFSYGVGGLNRRVIDPGEYKGGGKWEFMEENYFYDFANPIPSFSGHGKWAKGKNGPDPVVPDVVDFKQLPAPTVPFGILLTGSVQTPQRIKDLARFQNLAALSALGSQRAAQEPTGSLAFRCADHGFGGAKFGRA